MATDEPKLCEDCILCVQMNSFGVRMLRLCVKESILPVKDGVFSVEQGKTDVKE